MAASKENLLSLGHMANTDRNTFTKQRAHSSKDSVHRPLLMQTEQSHQHLRVIHLQQRWQELKERELTAQQHNRQLLQQFEKAQDTLREMLACNAAMKTIRIEYERYLEESTPRWQQQLKEKTQAAQRKRMEEYVRSCLNNAEQEQMTKSSADQLSLSHGLAKKPQKVSAPPDNNENSHHSQGVSSQLPYVPSSWLTHPPSQTARVPIRVPSQPQGSSHVPPSYLPPPIFPYPHQFQLFQQLPSSSSHHYALPRHDPPSWASSQPIYPWPWVTGAAGIPSGCGPLWGQPYMEDPPLHERGADVETSRASSSKRERSGGSRSSHLSHELDIKPVRLSNGHAESSESGGDSSQTSRERTRKRERRGKTQQSSSGRDGSSSHESSVTSSVIVIAGVAVAQSSESDTSSEQRSTGSSRRTRTRGGGFAAGLPRMEESVNGRTRRTGGDPGSHNGGSEPTSEEPVNQIRRSRNESVMKGSPGDKSDSCGEEESKSVSAEAENGDTDMESQERSISAEESNDEEKNEEDELEDAGEGYDGHDDEDQENNQRNEEQEERNVEEDDGDVSVRRNTANGEEEEEEEETGAEEELEDDGDDEDDVLKDEVGENRTQGSASASSEDEEEESEEENKMGDDKEESVEEDDGEDEEEEEEEERRSNEVEEERDSDIIIFPQETRLKKIHIIPEEEAEDEEEEQTGSKTGPSDDGEDSIGFGEEDDIEELLAPQEQTKKKEEKEPEVVDKPEATCDKVEVFQVELDNSTRTDQQSDSDEFDHFYD